jgi:hypothetical protein
MQVQMQGTGNINYSLNKSDFSKILINNTFTFVPFYFILVILSIAYLFKIKYSCGIILNKLILLYLQYKYHQT